jgi:hypothetical protein
MKFQSLSLAIILSLSFLSNAKAAGEPVTEDLSLLFTLSDTLIRMANDHNSEGFEELVDMALKLTAENRNNSIILPRASARFRAAKYAVRSGKFQAGVDDIQEAKTILMKKKVLKWDGGS